MVGWAVCFARLSWERFSRLVAEVVLLSKTEGTGCCTVVNVNLLTGV